MRIAPLAVLALALVATPATAQESDQETDHLALAEDAYQAVEFEQTRDHALEALRAGGLTPEQLVRCYMLLGVASSSEELHDEDAARDYFVRMLGINPDAELDASVNPQMRDPYLEARGMWAARPGRLEIEAGLDRPASSIRVELRDPGDLARRVRISARLEGDSEFITAEYEASTALAAPVTGAADADRVEYYVEVLDIHRNTILLEGSAFDPRVVGRLQVAGGGGGVTFLEEPLFWAIVGAALAVGAAITIGVIVDSRSRIGIQTGVSLEID